MKIKSTLRKQLVQLRLSLTSFEHSQQSTIICDNILSSSIFKDSNTVALYMNINNEVNLSPLLLNSKKILLPVLQPNNTMTFNHYKSKKSLVKNNFGILEPKNNAVIEPDLIDLCLVPLVGFNRNGNRLGMGGGYYDRYFALNQMQKKPTILAGIAFDFQENATIQAEPWDIPLNYIFTNNEIITV